MFFSLASVEVGTNLYWAIGDFTVHGQVLIVAWLVIITILVVILLSNVDLLGGYADTPILYYTLITNTKRKKCLPIFNWALAIYEAYFKYPATPLDVDKDDYKKYPSVINLILDPNDELGPFVLFARRIFAFLKLFSQSLFEFLKEIAQKQIGEFYYKAWISYIGTLFLFIFVSNWYGVLIPWKLILLSAGELRAPTSDINTTFALSLLTSINYFYAGLTAKGLGFFGRYTSPTVFFLPINILEDFTKPLSLSFRLFGNILADEIVLSVLCLLAPLFLPLPIMVLGLFTGSIQALVFATLSAAYIGESLE